MILKKIALGLTCLTLSLNSFAVVEKDQQPTKQIETSNYAKDTIIVKFKSGLKTVIKLQALSEMGLKVKKEINLKSNKYSKSDNIVSILSIKKGITVKEAITRLQDLGIVEYAEPDYILTKDSIGKNAIPNDTNFDGLWGLHNTGQTGGVFDADIDAVEAWDTVTGSTDAIVAVIDTGVDYTHPDLVSNMWQNPGEVPNNGIDDDGNGYVDDIYGIDCAYGDSDPMDGEGHGTHVAGTIGAAGNNGVGVVGVNWTTQIMAIKFLDDSGSGFTSDAVECLNYVNMMKSDYGFNIAATNNSWGGGGFSSALSDAIDESETQDILFVAAAGNASLDTDFSPHYPSSYAQDIVVSVAATNDYDDLAWFSNFGATSVDLAAPGQDIVSTFPGGVYGSISGTSMATPHVTGAAMLALANDSSLSALSLKAHLMNQGDAIASLSGITVSGKRLNIGNIIGCTPGTPSLLISSPSDGETLFFEETTVSASITDCGSPVVALDVEANIDTSGETIALLDDGIGADVAAGDGVYSGYWTPSIEGETNVAVSSSSLGVSDSSTVDVIDIPVYLVDDSQTYPYKDVTSGELLSISYYDDASTSVALDFPFTFYGIDYNSVNVGTNGQLVFGSSSGADFYTNTSIPDTDDPNNMIAAFWDDLYPGNSGAGIYVLREGTAPNREVTIGWVDVQHYPSTTSGVSFQVTFAEGSDDIIVNYDDTVFDDSSYDDGASATFGVESIDGTYGTLYSYATANVTDGMSLRYYLDDAIPPLEINNESPEKYGWNYEGVSNAQATKTFTFNSEGTNRWLHVRGHDIDYDDEICIDVNELEFTCLKTTANDTTRAVEQVIRIPATVQVGGVNTVTFNQINPGWKWGITDLGIFSHNHRYLPVNDVNESKYGWRWTLKSHKTQLKYGFYGSELGTEADAIFLKIQGYDINSSDEVCLAFNGNSIGCLLVGPELDLTDVQYIHLPESMIVNGLNVLTLTQKNQGHRWGVTNAGLLPVQFGPFMSANSTEHLGIFKGLLPQQFIPVKK